eukprot:353843-Chlamydomonas_euryale.AAC.13
MEVGSVAVEATLTLAPGICQVCQDQGGKFGMQTVMALPAHLHVSRPMKRRLRYSMHQVCGTMLAVCSTPALVDLHQATTRHSRHSLPPTSVR